MKAVWGLTLYLIVLSVSPAGAQVDSLAVCDQQFAAGDLAGSLTEARAVLDRDPQSYGAAWRLSRALISSANLAEDKETSRGLWLKARTLAERAIALNPEGTRGYTCLAVCAGSLSPFAKAPEKIELAEQSRQAARTAIQLDDRNDLAYLVLGIWNREIATIGGMTKFAAKVFYGGLPEGASLEESESCLRRAVELSPGHINHHRELAITLLTMDRLEEAIVELEIAVSLPARKPEDGLYAEDALQLLQEAREQWVDSQVENY